MMIKASRSSITDEALAGGVRLLVEAVDSSDTVSIGFWFRQGSRDEEADEKGLSHFLEHMLFKGTERRSALQIAKEVDRPGGMINAFTEKELTCYYITLPSPHFLMALDLLTDMTFHSLLDDDEVEKEKLVIGNEISGIDDSPEELAHEFYLDKIWSDHPLARRITGDLEDIRAVDRAKLLRFYQSRYVPENLVITIAGNVSSDLAVKQVANKLEADRNRPTRIDRKPPETRFIWSHQRSRFRQVQVYAGTHLPFGTSDIESLYTSLVMSTAMGESMSSRLFQEIRERQGLCYSIGSFRSLFSDCCLWNIYASSTPEQVPDLMGSLNRELGRLLIEPLSETEINDAISHLKGSLILSMADMEVRMKRLARIYLLTGKTLAYTESMAMIDKVTYEKVDSLVHSAIRSDAFGLTAYGGRRMRDFKELAFDF